VIENVLFYSVSMKFREINHNFTVPTCTQFMHFKNTKISY